MQIFLTIAFMNLATNCFQEEMQFPLNKKVEHCATTMCTFPIKGPPRLFGSTYTWLVQQYHFSFLKKIRLCQLKAECSCLLNLNVQLQNIHVFAPKTHSSPALRNSKVSGVGSSKGKNLQVGCNKQCFGLPLAKCQPLVAVKYWPSVGRHVC